MHRTNTNKPDDDEKEEEEELYRASVGIFSSY